MTYDVIVVGTGPAGLTAGLFAGRRGLDAVLFEKESIGGELMNRHRVENCPGIPEVAGTELRSNLYEQVEQYDVPIVLEEVTSIHTDDPFEIVTTNEPVRAETAILAGGGNPKRLDVPGSDQFNGRGVFDCAKCDGPLYGDEVVAVAGSSDWALTDALFLADHASEVIVIEPSQRLDAGETLRERVRSHPDIVVWISTHIEALVGTDVLEALKLRDVTDSDEWTESVDGLYVQKGIELDMGYLPEGMATTHRGEIEVDANLETHVPGIFAAGDIREGSSHTIAGAIGDGVTAFQSARRHLTK